MSTHLLLPESSVYRTMMLLALIVSFFFWSRRAKKDRRLLLVFLGAVLGGFAGAKIVFVLAEGWTYYGQPNFWLHMAAGKTIIGALLGGYIGIEIAKASIGYRQATGDWFAFIVPLGIASGRIGCLSQGCCQGIALGDSGTVWPAAAVEMGFNLLMVVVLFPLRRLPNLQGQLFHIYLIAYGAFRFAHEFLRATPKPFLGLSGYQVTAIILIAFGIIRFHQRSTARNASQIDLPETSQAT